MKVLRICFVVLCLSAPIAPFTFSSAADSITEAPAGFDGRTNGFTPQGNPGAPGTFESDRTIFDEREEIGDGLGPVYNAQSCGECHQNPVSGAISQITELRAGRFNGFAFTDQAGGSLINDRAINASIQERVLGDSNVGTFRTSLNTLGDGFVECINSNTLVGIAQNQPFLSGGRIAGQVIQVPVGEAKGALRTARFGWKNQHASLESFSADAYLNETGITSPLQPRENTSNGVSVAAFDTVADPEDEDGDDVKAFARFMRATKIPPRDTALAATGSAQAGSLLFDLIGCSICHVRTIVTAAPGTIINGGSLTVPAALGNKAIHPFGDFLLHDVGTGDGIVQNGGPSTRNKLRTPPLWGVRTRGRLMHDGETLNRNEAILRHAGEAAFVINAYRFLPDSQKNQIITFLNSL